MGSIVKESEITATCRKCKTHIMHPVSYEAKREFMEGEPLSQTLRRTGYPSAGIPNFENMYYMRKCDSCW
jgi:hypothetical protein